MKRITFLLLFWFFTIFSFQAFSQTTESFFTAGGVTGTAGNPGSMSFGSFDFTASTTSALNAFLTIPASNGYALFSGSELSEITIKFN